MLNGRLEVAANIAPMPSKVPAWERRFARRLVALDLLAVILSVGLAHWLRFGVLPGTQGPYGPVDYTAVSVVVAISWMLALSINRSRSPWIIGSGAEEYRRVLMATLTVFGGVAIVSMLLLARSSPRVPDDRTAHRYVHAASD